MVRVLIVDDEIAYRDSLSMLLCSEGFEVRTAENGREAYDIARVFSPDLLIVDWLLRDNADGIEVARRIQATNPGLPTVVISGYIGADMEARISELSSTCCLQKPFDADDIIDLAHALSGKDSQADQLV